ncbi:hypothetical protein [Streptomyces sp. NPDC002054]|uniref:hypothetical protein n=1 Tax=Streptomyces sp. NPDC002054 TaxID=3154663 RepID=UPI00331DAD0D
MTVGYEQQHGLREAGQPCDGDGQAGGSSRKIADADAAAVAMAVCKTFRNDRLGSLKNLPEKRTEH